MGPLNLQIKLIEGADHKKLVLSACRSMLRPIIRILLKSGIVHRDLMNVTREVYIDVARTEFGLRGRPTSISRTALLTGLARKEVRRIMNIMDSGDAEAAAPGTQDRISRVLSGWFQDEDYLTRDGQPRPVPAEGPAPSFADLKSRYGGDIPASTILRELLNSKTVEKREDGLLLPATRNFRPNPTEPEYFVRAASVYEDIGTTVVRNLYRKEGDAKWFERRATNTCMSEAMLPQFRSMLNAEGQKFLENVDAWMSAHEDESDGDSSIRLGVGMYIIKTSDPD